MFDLLNERLSEISIIRVIYTGRSRFRQNPHKGGARNVTHFGTLTETPAVRFATSARSTRIFRSFLDGFSPRKVTQCVPPKMSNKMLPLRVVA